MPMRDFVNTVNAESKISSYKPYIPVMVATANDVVAVGTREIPYGIAFRIESGYSDIRLKAIDSLIKGNNPFLLVINRSTNLPDDRIIELIILCLFSKNYIQTGTSPVIAFLYEHPGEWEEWGQLFSEVLISKLTAQGWPSIRIWNLNEQSFRQQIEAKKEAPLFVTQVDVDEAYLEKNYFFNFRYVGDYIFFKRNTLRAAMELEQYFAGICQAIIANAPVMKGALEEYVLLKKQYMNLEVDNAVLEERLRNAQITIEVIRSKYKDDYEQLIKWYHNEYEILPLWFKRLGHIVKVLMGRRSFRSLFYDHVKKYKD
jgi:hypothetical protein